MLVVPVVLGYGHGFDHDCGCHDCAIVMAMVVANVVFMLVAMLVTMVMAAVRVVVLLVITVLIMVMVVGCRNCFFVLPLLLPKDPAFDHAFGN